MTRWLMERLTITFAVIIGLGAVFAFNTMRSILLMYIAEIGVEALSVEGKVAMTLLIVLLIGSVKIYSNR